MDDPRLLTLIGATLVVLFLLLRLSRPKFRRDMPFTKRASLLTVGEMRFYRVLLAAIPPNVPIFVKVRLMDVVAVPDDAWKKYGAVGSGMHCDFVLVDADLAPVLVIELDDKSHWSAQARERDAFKDAALASAGVPILRVVAGRYDAGELKARIRVAVGGNSSN